VPHQFDRIVAEDASVQGEVTAGMGSTSATVADTVVVTNVARTSPEEQTVLQVTAAPADARVPAWAAFWTDAAEAPGVAHT